MALLCALQCPLSASGKRAVDTAVIKVGREYKDFCAQYFQVPVGAESWKEDGSFSLTCFTSRVDIGYFIISTYQSICNDNSIPATSDFASTIKQECWDGIAKSLLIGGLKLTADKVDKETVKTLGKELQRLLKSNKGHLQEFLLSLLQMNYELAYKVSSQLMHMYATVCIFA
jgi:hypothetical protein